ncbi:MAG: pyruvate dehydrogenase (acetyl-transferring) E1 component subunit alpha [Candidatus Nanohaloarchaeota archaeon QJJ-9]|nr:pyruvate dehydrogenase (acetyl-transferring) E1 component subunit alpha [Candidatus Nanohaloarchaeota archaeon QJJ-9]
MPYKELDNGVKRLEILDENGEVDEELEPQIGESRLLEMYKDFVLSRKLDEKIFKMQRRGEAGTYARFKGQEASQIGPAYAMDSEDWFVPSFREGAFWVSRGLSLKKFFRYWMGDEFGHTVEGNNMPLSIPVGSQISHAAGIGIASQVLEKDAATLVYFGDGATSQGDFHSGMNFAGTFNLPVVFLCQNNQYAISTPREKQTAAKSLAQKARAYGFEGIQVDGNDVLAMYKAVKDALNEARQGKGPKLIEAVTYRVTDHTTSDDWTRYRDKEEVKRWKEKDPLDRFESYLKDKSIIEEEKIEEVEDKADEKVEKVAEEAKSMEDPEPEKMFEHVYSETPERLKRQLESLKSAHGGDS